MIMESVPIWLIKEVITVLSSFSAIENYYLLSPVDKAKTNVHLRLDFNSSLHTVENIKGYNLWEQFHNPSQFSSLINARRENTPPRFL